MRAVVITDTSNRSVSIADLPDPVPGDDQILVDVKACAVNFTDLLSLDGKYQNNPPPQTNENGSMLAQVHKSGPS